MFNFVSLVDHQSTRDGDDRQNPIVGADGRGSQVSRGSVAGKQQGVYNPFPCCSKLIMAQTLREELRKVQSSAALLERQRNPGVGYWTSRSESAAPDVRTSLSSTSSDSRVASPAPEPTSSKNEEEVNLEYLRNVILQFLEHKEMRVRRFFDLARQLH